MESSTDLIQESLKILRNLDPVMEGDEITLLLDWVTQFQ